MTLYRFIISLTIIFTLATPTISLAKVGIRLQQKIALITSQAKDGTLHITNSETYSIHDEETKRKASEFVGKQARILYFNMAQKKICVNIAPITEPQFETTAPRQDKAKRPL